MYHWEQQQQASASKKKAHSSNVYHASASIPTSFESLGEGMVRPATIASLQNLGFTSLLPAQARCYAHIFRGQDAVLHSRTGTGKTLAFLLPLIERQMLDADRQKLETVGPWLIVLVPTIELAAQIQRVINEVYSTASSSNNRSKNGGGSVRCLTAGLEVTTAEDLSANPCDVLVGTISAVDRVVRLRQKIPDGSKKDNKNSNQHNSSHGGGGSRQQQPGQKNVPTSSDDDDDDEEDEEEEDDEDLVDEDEEEDNNGRKKGEDRRRQRATTTGKDQNSAQRSSKNNNSNKASPRKKTKKFVAAPSVQGIRAVVIDEVDHTLGPKFSASARRVRNMLRCIRVVARNPIQCVLVGATIPDWVQRVGFLGDPNRRVTFRLVSAGASKLPSELKCFVIECSRDQDRRVELTLQLLAQLAPKRVVVFAPTKLVEQIFSGATTALSAVAGSSDNNNNNNNKFTSATAVGTNNKKKKKSASGGAVENDSAAAPPPSQPALSSSFAKVSGIRRLDSAADDLERLKVIQEFNDGVASVLVCTDRASRGLDFVDIDTVVCTSFPAPAPTSAETFVHRAGRASRVGKAGNCITLIDPQHSGEVTSKRMIESTAHIAFRVFDTAEGGAAAAAAVADSASPLAADAAATTATTKVAKATATTSSSRSLCHCRLKVKNPFTSSARPARAAKDVLLAALSGGDLQAQMQLRTAAPEAPVEMVDFDIPKRLVEDFRSALWKYDFSVVQQSE